MEARVEVTSRSPHIAIWTVNLGAWVAVGALLLSSVGVGRPMIRIARATIEPPTSSQLASPEANLHIELWSALMGMASSFGQLRRAESSSTIWHVIQSLMSC